MTLILNATAAEIARVMNAIAIIVVYFLIVIINCLLLFVNCFISHRKDRWFFITLQVFSPFFGFDIATQVPNSDNHSEHSLNLSPSIAK